MTERAGEGLLRDVLSCGSVQATDLERPHEPRVVRFVDGNEVPGYVAREVVFDDDSLSQLESPRSPIALTVATYRGGWQAGIPTNRSSLSSPNRGNSTASTRGTCELRREAGNTL